jgi:hypothetical protein
VSPHKDKLASSNIGVVKVVQRIDHASLVGLSDWSPMTAVDLTSLLHVTIPNELDCISANIFYRIRYRVSV